MFSNQESLPHLLTPQMYYSRAFWDVELTQVIGRSWQFIAFATELAVDGSQVAGDISGVPVVVRNFGGELRAFKNVCAHRHSLIVKTGASKADTFKCGYHGWEYGSEGQLSKIIDGKSFKGFKVGGLCLERFRVERLGPMVFVNVSNEGPGFAESLGDYVREFEEFFAHHRLLTTWTTRHKVNWKIIEENAVESYHVPQVHPKTFGNYLPEVRHDHSIEPRYTRYADTEPWGQDGRLLSRAIRLLTALIVRSPKYQNFIHVHLFPNTLLYYTELVSTFQIIRPIGPEESEYKVHFFVPNEYRWPVVSSLLQRLTAWPIVMRIRQILLEDVSVWYRAHAGLKSSQFNGVLSCREERVYAFQKFIADRIAEREPAELLPPDLPLGQ